VAVQLQMIQLERAARTTRDRVKKEVLGGADPTLRDRLFRAAAAWLIGWAAIMGLLTWGHF
jgi:hypothetical protein